MAPSHRYDLIKEGDDVVDEPHNTRRIPSITPWWKVLLYMLLAASAGLGAALGVVLGSSLLKPSGNAATSLNATASTTLSSDLTLATTAPSIDLVDDKVNDPDGLAGKILDCGHSPEEARAAGCVYDVMMQDWVPEPCFDEVLTERYLAEGNYTWYADSDGNVMSDEEMRKGEHHEAWMTGGYHKAHCIFSWEKLIRAERNNRPISQELLSYDHVLHCRMQTLGGEMHKRDAIAVRAPTNYAKCALYDTWKTDFIPDKHNSTAK